MNEKLYLIIVGKLIKHIFNCKYMLSLCSCRIKHFIQRPLKLNTVLKMLDKFIKIFKANSLSHLIIIFIVFGITGSLSVVLSEPILSFLRLDEITNYVAINLLLRVLVVLIVYQILLILVGALFGQFDYFRKIQRRFLVRIRLLKEQK